MDSYSLKLRKTAEKIKDRIVFTGYIDYSEMLEIYALRNVAVLPSMWDEPAGMTMVEAAISGNPLITTNPGGIPESIPFDAAIILERDENLVKNITASIYKIMYNKEYAGELSNRGRELRYKLNLNKFYKKFWSIIKG